MLPTGAGNMQKLLKKSPRSRIAGAGFLLLLVGFITFNLYNTASILM
jgi:hypothetical protein